MKKILVEEIEGLSPEIQTEVLKYMENLVTSESNNSSHRMTLDRFQNDTIQKYVLKEKKPVLNYEPMW